MGCLEYAAKSTSGRDVEVTNLLGRAFFKQLTYPEVANKI